MEWPPRSPDLTPFDFYLRGYSKAMVYQGKIQNINHLKERITPAALIRVLQQWRTRIKMCFHYNGSHIEHII